MTSSVGKRVTVRPPEKGSFPLDHEGRCKKPMEAYLECMKANDGGHGVCNALSKRYLECRMQKGIMQQEDLNTLGFDSESMETAKTAKDIDSGWEEGYVAGSSVRSSGFWRGLLGLKDEGDA